MKRLGRGLGLGLALALGASLSCTKSDSSTIIDVRVELSYRAVEGTITVLQTTVEDANHFAKRDFFRPGKPALTFPVTFGIELAADVTGPIKIEVAGVDASGVVRARGSIAAQAISRGKVSEAKLWLVCPGNCPADAGVDTGPPDGGVDAAGQPEAGDPCGNGRLDPGETCDIAIPRGQTGACPTATCDDMLACTTDMRFGSACNTTCGHVEMTKVLPDDGCCPAGATNLTDPDCSATCGNGQLEPGEFCDKGVPPGSPTACPVAADCPDKNACTSDILLSANTCNAICAHREITTFISGDGCCPVGATHGTDSDCPVVCGNGIVETGEACDTGILPGDAGSCPAPCPPRTACGKQVTEGTGCQATCREVPITEFVGGDGCCPPSGNRALDTDCKAVCGNGVFEPTEVCDRGIGAGAQGACPTACAPAEGGCMPRTLSGSRDNCTIHCVAMPISNCAAQADGCCPEGCSSANDPDCSATCGNGVVEIAETCDTAIPFVAGVNNGACPRQCDDGNVCTNEMLLSRGTCNARCQSTPITMFANDDGCCPAGGNHNLDDDCPSVCGNAVVEGPQEWCEPAIAMGNGSCPASCSAPKDCRRFTLVGEPMTCTARCESTEIKECVGGDSCCPMGCNRDSDTDCPAVCGNGIVDAGEACDRGITAGKPGACLATCDDGKSCTIDSTSGRVEDCTRTCSHVSVTACTAGDRCCPKGCDGTTDSDCVPVCGNNLVEDMETCDPESSCPTICADDGDPCTREVLSGAANLCRAVCVHVPITDCSGSSADQCCPNPGCSSKSETVQFDTDCTASSLTP